MCLNKDEIPDLYRFWNLFGARAWLKAYDKLGVENVRFDAIGDFVRIDDERKMTGYAVSGSKDVYFIGGIITANPLNMDLFMETSMIPKEKFADKKARDSRSWVADVSEIIGSKIDVEEVYKALVAAYQEELGVQFVAGELTDEEKRLLPEYVKNLSSEEVIQRCSCRKFAERAPKEAKIDAFNYKVEKLLRPIVAIKEDKIVDIMLTGDWYIYPAEVIDEIEEAMKGMPIDEHKIYLELTKIWEKHPDIEDFWCDPCFFAHAIAAAGKSAKEL
jgi:lipoate-protein ligase A